MDEQKVEEMTEEIPEQEPETPARDYGEQVRELFQARPELRGQELPQEVLLACVDGKPLTEAYSDYARAHSRDAESLRRENRVLRQNAQSAARAPVRGVSRGGGPDAQPEDAFLWGFNTQW